ncbi:MULTISPECIES: hypothetical protein [unclassified Arthrobacter]|uniref:hypothetical protein n=1 Tax=unclassified Arthrobacter TaxID=235627 RepID=UPI002E02D37B|nr:MULTISPECIES: hypothetical protein [unclassified Arthrobacter]MEC5191918.1 membrane-bound ClpP family serine protease [Arthrobacter sp. MP_M4]MEC5202423.1 membrane-bound ClpP family serine protease [Arthrobacter sp. MP_M7]
MRKSLAVNLSRAVLGVAGVAILGYGLLGLPTQLGARQLMGLLTWMAVAILIHDGVLVPLSTLAGAGLTLAGAKLQSASAAVLRGALLLGAVVTLVVGILMKAQSVAQSVTVLEADYAMNLLWFWVFLVLVSGVVIVVLERRARRVEIIRS